MNIVTQIRNDKVYQITCLFVLAVILISNFLPTDLGFGRSRMKSKSRIQRKMEDLANSLPDTVDDLTCQKAGKPDPKKMPVVDPEDEPDYSLEES